MNNKLRYRNMTITTKITIMYGGIFSLSIIIISMFIMGYAMLIRESAARNEVSEAVGILEESVRNGTELNDETVFELLENVYVDIIIFDFKNGETYRNSLSPLPHFIVTTEKLFGGIMGYGPPNGGNNAEQNSSGEFDENKFKVTVSFESIPPALGIDEKDIRELKDEFDSNSRSYTIQTDNNREFMIVQKVISVGENNYFVQAYKMYPDQMYYMRSFAARIMFIDIFGIFIAFLIGKYISRLILKPVDNIRQTAEQISIDDLSQRIELEGPDDEMKELAVTFNSMIDRLEEAFDKQNQFISDASHELKTPISVIQGYANLINRWGKSDPGILQESIDSIIAETDHMNSLTKMLLFLAKGEQNKTLIHKQKISLNEVTKEVIKELDVMNVERNVEFEETDEVMIYADYDLIKRLLWIYTDNAIKYTDNEGLIKFNVYHDNGYGYVSVADNGAGMESSQIPLIFDRFYRVDKSRNKEIPGTGLGLSIAKWIIDTHYGEIIVESEDGSGSTFISKFKLMKT